MKYEILDGNKACSLVSYMFSEAACIYPITPASTMAENVDVFASSGKTNFFGDKVKVVEMQSEAGAIAAVHGMLTNGVLATTYTASQGLLLMIPNMYKIAGELLPCVINVAARTIATHALSIMGDHSDIYATRSTGFAIIASSSVEEIQAITSVAYLSTLKGRIPFVNFFDGFRTSHEYNKVSLLNMKKVKKLIDKDSLDQFRNRSMDIDNPTTRGTNEGDSIYFQTVESRNRFYNELPDIVNSYMEDINDISGLNLKPFNYYGSKKATKVIVAMGSVCSTVRELIEKLNDDSLGLIEVHLYRPFSKDYFLNVLPRGVKKIAVLDRTKEAGSVGEPLYLDVCEVIKKENLNIDVVGGRYGLSSKDTTLNDIETAYKYLDKAASRNFTIGITDDVTKLSLKPTNTKFNDDCFDMLIYGYGSDGMITASKDILKIVGYKDFVQGYFYYDSKKSGGLTISHLRFDNKKIDKPYYVKNPSFVVVSKDTYLRRYDVLDGIKEEGVFLLNTEYSKDKLSYILPLEVINTIKKKKLKFYIINASKIARDNNIPTKISMIMETAIIHLNSFINEGRAKKQIIDMIHNNFDRKGSDVVNSNINAVSDALKYLECVDIKDIDSDIVMEEVDDSIFSYLEHNKGDLLPVSSFLNRENGTFEPSLSRLEKRGIASLLPYYDSKKCIGCNLCSFVCPHAVIRPYLLDDQEVLNAPSCVKENIRDERGSDYKFSIGISPLDCTGCGLCAGVCPTKALSMKKFNEECENLLESYNYLQTVSQKKLDVKPNVKSIGFVKPKFEFSGACSGCGETPYLKLLTQLFGDNLIIANATGCSSIYGASVPNTPYSVPWANSLFEDNAEFGYGMRLSEDFMQEKIKKVMRDNLEKLNSHNKELALMYLNNYSKEVSVKVYNELDYDDFKEMIPLKKYIKEKSIWAIGGDGWAYDIGFSGIDHVIANNENINILVLDTEVYSNTGGQSSKSTRLGAVAKFAKDGKKTPKKDLAKIALTYPNCYVATVSLGANYNQVIKAFNEANNYNGPSIIIAYAPCIAHGIRTGMKDSIKEEKLVVDSGYFPLFRYNPTDNKFNLDSKADFKLYDEIFERENRYFINKDSELLELNKKEAMKRFSDYENKD